MANSFQIEIIDQISEIPSEVLYIKRFIGRLKGSIGSSSVEFFFGFSLEKTAIGLPEVAIKYIDDPPEAVTADEQQIANLIREMEKTGELKHSPFEGI